jgi:hypothetical protein
VRILLGFDDEKAEEESISTVMDVFRAIGALSIPYLVDIIEKKQGKGRIYGYSIVALGGIASTNKSEDIYRLLKDCFRKSSLKLVEASALAAYGDGRAIAALRSHVERNMGNIDPWQYYQYRDIILSLGGLIDDLDAEFQSIYGHMHEHHHDHNHENDHDHEHHHMH